PRRDLGASGIRVPPVGIGTWAIGGTWWGGTEEPASIAAIRTALDAGIDLIDTAPVYGYGLAEEIVGKAIRGVRRDRVIIATKVGLDWNSTEGRFFFELWGRKVFRNLRPASIRMEVEQSLRRLRIDCIDVCQTHWQDPSTPIADTMAELLRLREAGKIRAIGVSNATPAQMSEYLAAGPLASNQTLLSMLDRTAEAVEIPFCRGRGVAVLAYSPLALGLLTGRITPNREFPEGDQRRNHPRFTAIGISRVNAMLVRFAPFREKYGLDQTQLAIAWTASRPGVTTALVGVRNADQAAALAPAASVRLAPDDLAAMDRIIVEAGF
ncbi:MAG: aldo/keto reductase, partial [Deltaproteobacteria bacterium]|nr:aldo/keto reductase [Deltaproteobacteria bacterium]